MHLAVALLWHQQAGSGCCVAFSAFSSPERHFWTHLPSKCTTILFSASIFDLACTIVSARTRCILQWLSCGINKLEAVVASPFLLFCGGKSLLGAILPSKRATYSSRPPFLIWLAPSCPPGSSSEPSFGKGDGFASSKLIKRSTERIFVLPRVECSVSPHTCGDSNKRRC